MKNKKQFKYCEYCNEPHEDISPPTKQQYEEGLISLHEMFSTLLLPKKVAKARTTKGYSIGNSFDLAGTYCNRKCLNNHIKQVLNSKGKK